MNRVMLKQYTILVDFLSQTLGPDYEIALHDLSGGANSIVALANGHISGRTLGAPLTSMALKTIAAKSYETSDFRINYSGLSNGNKVLRSSTLYIKDGQGKLAGLLCINFDDSRYQELSTKVFQLCHPDQFMERNIVIRSDILDLEKDGAEEPEEFSGSVSAVAHSVIREVVSEDGVPAHRLTQSEKVRIVAMLDQRGIFLLKGAVVHVAKALCCSQASVYRYLARAQGRDGTGEDSPPAEQKPR